jgi:hypothetical protein
MKCPECNGTGKISNPNTPYRTAANKVKEVLKPAANVFVRSYAKVKHGAYVMTVGKALNWTKTNLLWPAVIGCAIAGVVYLIIVENNYDHKHHRTITVQFADNGQAARCWTGYSTPSSFFAGDHYSWKVVDINKIEEGKELLGIPKDMTCKWYDIDDK